MIINHNMSAIFTQRQLKFNNLAADKDMEKLASGYRINRAGDDASGLAVSEKMRAQVRGLTMAGSNAQNAISFIQTAEGYLQESQDILQRIRELAVQASNGIYSSEDRMQIQVEVSQMVDEINRIASHAQFNGMNMLTGRFARSTGENVITGSMWFHIGANMDQRERAYIGTMTAQGLGVQSTNGLTSTATFISISTPDKANMSIGVLDKALQTVSKQRADLGAYQNRLEYTMKGLSVGAENLQASESRIRDADMALEMVSFVRDQILVQSATAMLAQANTLPQTVLQLFR
jgi:flagellin